MIFSHTGCLGHTGSKSQQYIINPHMHEIFLQLYCMKWVHGDPQKEMLN